MDDILKDKRFAHVVKDPRFRRMPVGERKVKIDKRFKGMFKDRKFKLKYSVDKRGKPVNLSTNENLQRYYELSDKDTSDSDTDEEQVDDVRGSVKKNFKSRVSEKNKGLKKSVRPDKSVKLKASTDNKELNKLSESDNTKEKPQTESSESVIVNRKKTNHDDDHHQVPGASDPRFKTKLHQRHKMKNSERKRKENVSKKGNRKGQSDDESSNEDEQERDSEASEESSDDEEVTKPTGDDSGVDFARGEGNIESSSSDDDDDNDESDDDDDESDDDDDKDVNKFDHKWGEADENIIDVEEATYRLAVCNMDWDRMKATDIFVLLNSFKPADGLIKSVKIYPSEFGKERMAEEAVQGPRELTELKLDSDNEETDTVNEEGTTYHREKLRQYQLKRLKYYYAVVVCDSVATADHIYKECDGMEYESSATKLDLRFIPDEETFNEDEVNGECTEVPVNFKPQYFANAALAQSKVELTWDETDPDRVQLTSQQFLTTGEEGEEEDLKAYLASSSDEEGPDYGALLENANRNESGEESGDESDEDKKLDKYKQLLADIDTQEKKKKPDVEMEISWEPGLRETTENLVKKKKQSKNSTVWDEYLEKRKEKKKKKMEERKMKKKLQEQGYDDGQKKEEELIEDGMQAFSDDELPVDADMAAFMAEENSAEKKKSKKRKPRKKGTEEENVEAAKQKAELALLMMDEDDRKKHFNLQDLMIEDGEKKKKKKKKQKEQKNKNEDDFQVDVSDPRFSAVYESHLFNIDPSAPEYRKTKGTEAIISEKVKRKRVKNGAGFRQSSNKEHEQVKKPKFTDSVTVNDDNLASLIKSVKSKTKHFHSNKSKS